LKEKLSSFDPVKSSNAHAEMYQNDNANDDYVAALDTGYKVIELGKDLSQEREEDSGMLDSSYWNDKVEFGGYSIDDLLNEEK
jgi:hypothetical protein